MEYYLAYSTRYIDDRVMCEIRARTNDYSRSLANTDSAENAREFMIFFLFNMTATTRATSYVERRYVRARLCPGIGLLSDTGDS